MTQGMAGKRNRCYMAERSIVCIVFIFIEAITGLLNSVVVRDDYTCKINSLIIFNEANNSQLPHLIIASLT